MEYRHKNSIFVSLLIRLNGLCKKPAIGICVRPLYRIYCLFISVDIPWRTNLPKDTKMSHPIGLVINAQTVIGHGCWFRQGTTIGNKEIGGECPKIGNNVQIGANAIIIGDISIGDGCQIGAGSVVLKDLEPNSVVVGNPARVIRRM